VTKSKTSRLLHHLAEMTRLLGDPANDYVVHGEGNTSVLSGQDTFWIKISGIDMASVDLRSFVRVRTEAAIAVLESPDMPETEVRKRLKQAKSDPMAPGSPSIETAMHAVCLSLGGARFVAHTHPTPVTAILCSQRAEEAFSKVVLPSEAMICGEPLFVPYAPPGQPLARAVRAGLSSYTENHGFPPRVMLLQNHGLVVMAPTPRLVLDMTANVVKAARILLGAYSLGGPHFIDF
jgi:rhamnose utilization protein RhaD (predicted bifunctional aldolase and dehydrogenase)